MKSGEINRLEGFDYLRAIMSVFVVVWHMKGAGQSLIFSDQYHKHVFTISDFVNFHILLLAVSSLHINIKLSLRIERTQFSIFG